MASDNIITSLPNLQTGEIVDNKYQIQAPIGKGGMSVLYLATSIQSQREFVIKFLLPKRQSTLSITGIKRFQQEIQICAKLRHPNIIRIYNCGVYRNCPYIIMKYIQGTTITNYYQEQHTTDWKHQATTIKKVAQGLHYIHKKNIIHRDIKPSNILMQKNEEPIIIDFGIAKDIDNEDWNLTKKGEILGTVQYMSVEQIECNQELIGPRTDIYSLGLVLFEIATKKAAYSNNLVQALQEKILNKCPYTPRSINPDIPIILENIILKAIQKDPKNRYKTAQEFSQALDDFINDKITLPLFYKLPSFIKIPLSKISSFFNFINDKIKKTHFSKIPSSCKKFLPQKFTKLPSKENILNTLQSFHKKLLNTLQSFHKKLLNTLQSFHKK
ncbi:MAG: serine/threonine protein kinase [Planctomycetes bacterium]|nr:serine/threonine protein kinase [Planctomycetota bacterium]HPY74613.1 serine/threonine-protein kinase [Planctomycetota bacterium]HQB00253.1 serine/threonine-protein kinase [Planctomycetota bacterium]